MRHHFTVWVIAALLGLAAAPAAADGMTEMTRLLKGGDSALMQGQTATAAKTTVSGDPKAIRLTPDRTKILRLRESAASVIVANPAHATVTLDSPRLLILMPREPGTTSFTVLNAAGKVLLERNIIVSAVQPQYVRVRRVCGNANDCQPSNYYYCPDGCFEVTPVVHENNANIPEVQGNAAAAGVTAPIPEDPMIAEEIEGPMPTEDDGILEDDAPDSASDALEGEAE
ncbi:MAG: pilus assembly protein N-terminal domain-containing protein [Alphaproteobacteria bacterium]|nr:pilus assembly protein N-terminal domain-containing protein [Alphaproteobacteria bacterium]